VLVTGVGGRAVGHQILHALSYVKDAYRVVAADMDRFSFGLYGVERQYLIPAATAPDYREAIVRIVRKEGVSALLPGTEIELPVLTAAASELSDAGCTVIANPHPVVRRCQDKAELHRWLSENGAAGPRTVEARHWRDLIAEVGFPIVGKPRTGTGASRDVAILVDEAEVQWYLERIPGGAERAIFQEYVGDAESEYTVGVMVSRSGSVIDSIALHRRLSGLSLGQERLVGGRRYAISTGYSQGYIVDHPEVRGQCEELALRVGARGPLNVQLRFVEGRIRVFEVHPRFSGTTSIRADVGFNEPDVLIRHFVLGEECGRIPYRRDVAAIRALQAVIVPVSTMSAVPEA